MRTRISGTNSNIVSLRIRKRTTVPLSALNTPVPPDRVVRMNFLTGRVLNERGGIFYILRFLRAKLAQILF